MDVAHVLKGVEYIPRNLIRTIPHNTTSSAGYEKKENNNLIYFSFNIFKGLRLFLISKTLFNLSRTYSFISRQVNLKGMPRSNARNTKPYIQIKSTLQLKQVTVTSTVFLCY